MFAYPATYALDIYRAKSRQKSRRATHRGAATIAIKGAAVLTPVLITVSPSTLTKQEKWYKIPPRRFVMTLRVLDDIDPSAYRHTSSDPIAARRLNHDLIDLYTQELNRG